MFQLTSRQRFAFYFTLYLFIFIIILYSLFFTIFNFMTNYQIKKSLFEHMREIISNRLVIENNQITFKKDSDGSSLREFLVNEDLAAVFFDSQNNLIRSYGFFAITNNLNLEKKIKPLVKQVIISKKFSETKLEWDTLKLKAFAVPLIYKKNISGVMILAKSISDYEVFQQTMLTVFAILGTVTLIGSFLIGSRLAFKIFLPIRELTTAIEQLDFEKSEIYVNVKGNSKDELIILASKFNEMTDRLRDMNRRQKEFIANVSHELKTPLTRAITSVDLVKSDNQNLYELKLIKDDLFHINLIIEKLLLLTKMKKDIHISTKPQTITVTPLFNRLKILFDAQLIAKKLTLIGVFPQKILINLPVEFLEIIFSNLISNAIKFSHPNKIIRFIIKEIDNNLVMRLVDQGIGMSTEEINHMFKRFYQSNQNDVKTGYGIGLSLVKLICDLYKIQLKVNSEVNNGTTITLVFS